MTYTEEQAKQKWCPMVRLGDYVESSSSGVSYNRTIEGNNYCNCIASKCMMWKYDGDKGSCGLIK